MIPPTWLCDWSYFTDQNQICSENRKMKSTLTISSEGDELMKIVNLENKYVLRK